MNRHDSLMIARAPDADRNQNHGERDETMIFQPSVSPEYWSDQVTT